MKHRAIVPNIFTALALSCGTFVIFKMSMLPAGGVTFQNVLASVLILMLAAFLDFIDGAVARAMKVQSDFGCFFDSMADAISFGIAPSVIILKTLSVEPKTIISFFLTTGAMIYSISGVLRLVRYSVTSHQIQQDKEKTASNMANFTGLPIPAAAAISTSTTLLLFSDDFRSYFPVSDDMRAIVATVVFFVIGFFMVSRWKFPSLKKLQIRVTSYRVVLLTAFIAAIVLASALHQFSLVYAILSWAYFFVAIILSIVRIASGKKLQALEDFEPESEEQDTQDDQDRTG